MGTLLGYWLTLEFNSRPYLVILGHVVKDVNDPVRVSVYAFHMPLFFFLSGYLHKEQKVKDSIMNAFRKLLLPYFYFAFLIVIIWIGYLCFQHKFDAIIPFLRGYVKNIVLGRENVFKGSWFLLALFWVKTGLDLLLQVRKKGIQIGILILLILVLSVLKFLNMPNFVYIESALMALPFYALGFYLNKYNLLHKIENYFKFDLIKYIAAGIIFLLLLFIGVYFNGRVSMLLVLFGNYKLFYFTALTGIALVYCVSNLFTNQRCIIHLLSAGSLVVFITHFYIIDFLHFAFQKVFFVNDGIMGLVSFAILCIEIPIVIIFNRYLPFMLGGRKIKNKQQ